MQLLVVMEDYPLPMRTGSTIVGFNTLRQLSARHDIDLMCFRPEGDFMALGLNIRDVHLIQCATPNPISRFCRRLLFWVSPRFDFRGDRGFRNAIDAHVRARSHDAILLFGLGSIKHCPPHLLHRAAVNMEDAQSLRIGRMARLPVWSARSRLKLRMVAWLTRRYERAFLPRMGKVLLLSRRDIEDMGAEGKYPSLEYVPYGVVTRDATDITSYSSRKRAIVYSGNMFHPPNVDGALFFLNEIFTRVLREEPEAILWIVGADPDERIIKAASAYGASVKVTGRVANLTSYLATALVSICPVRLHIGVQTKVLESLSLGTPVVTTSAGNRGIGGTSGVHLHVEDDAERFATRVCELLAGKNWEKLSTEGRTFAESNFSWEGSARILESHLMAMAGREA